MNRYNLLPILLLFSITTHSQISWVMEEERKEDRWTIESDEIFVISSVNGNNSHGDRLRVFLSPSDDCEYALLATTFHTTSKAPDLPYLKDVPVTIELYGGQLGAMIDFVHPLVGSHVAWVSIWQGQTTDMKEVFTVMNEETDEFEFEVVSTENFQVERYLDLPANRWSLDGSMESLEKAEFLCKRIAADTFL